MMPAPAPAPRAPRPPLLVAHRGASLVAPENTLEAFDVAARLGAGALALDVRASLDGVLVVARHADLAVSTDGTGALAAQPARALARLDAGYGFVTAAGERPFRGRGARLPLLEEVLRAFAHLGLMITLWPGEPQLVPLLLAALERAGPRTAVLTAPDAASMAALVGARPGCGLGLSRGERGALARAAWRGTVPPALAGRVAVLPAWRFGLPGLGRRVLSAARALDLRLLAGVVDAPAIARRALARGADGILTRDPARLCALFPSPS